MNHKNAIPALSLLMFIVGLATANPRSMTELKGDRPKSGFVFGDTLRKREITGSKQHYGNILDELLEMKRLQIMKQLSGFEHTERYGRRYLLQDHPGFVFGNNRGMETTGSQDTMQNSERELIQKPQPGFVFGNGKKREITKKDDMEMLQTDLHDKRYLLQNQASWSSMRGVETTRNQDTMQQSVRDSIQKPLPGFVFPPRGKKRDITKNLKMVQKELQDAMKYDMTKIELEKEIKNLLQDVQSD